MVYFNINIYIIHVYIQVCTCTFLPRSHPRLCTRKVNLSSAYQSIFFVKYYVNLLAASRIACFTHKQSQSLISKTFNLESLF